jgi:type IV secretory pathway TraG/TraD family ATPase VirD4
VKKRKPSSSGLRSLYVVDPNGAIGPVTSTHRRRVSDVKIINPFGLHVDERLGMGSSGRNPLGDLDPDAADFGKKPRG